jgi:farnesyl-diphosphate farnesyltransferase
LGESCQLVNRRIRTLRIRPNPAIVAIMEATRVLAQFPQAGRMTEDLDPEHREQALKVLDMMTDKAERHLRHALQYVKSLPWWLHGIRLGCIFPLMFAIRTLAVSRHNAQVFESEAKMTRKEVQKIVLDSTLWGWSNLWLDRYYQELNVVQV